MKRIWHWLTDAEVWRAKYRDGKVTCRMSFSSAANLVAIFGGEVEYDPC